MKITRSTPIETDLGILTGRDCIYLDKISIPRTDILVISGGLNGQLCSRSPSEKEISYSLKFTGVLALKITELESSVAKFKSSFDEMESSPWLAEVSKGDKFTEKHKHYLVQTYDDVIEVICKNYVLNIETNLN